MRDAIAAAAGAAIDNSAAAVSPDNGSSKTIAATGLPADGAAGPLAGASAEVVQPAAFAAVAQHYRASPALHARLLRWVWAPQPAGDSANQCASAWSAVPSYLTISACRDCMCRSRAMCKA